MSIKKSWMVSGKQLGERLRKLMQEKSLSVSDLASAGGIDESTMGAILSGNINRPPDRRLSGFAKRLGVSLESLQALVSKQTIVIAAHEIDDAPQEFQLFPYGETVTDDGTILVDEEAMELTIAYVNARGNDLVIDYEHQTLYGGQAPAAARIPRLINKGTEGLWVESKWTDKAKAYISNREYFYFSPVSLVRQSDRRLVGLHSVALTNSPKTHNMSLLAAKANIFNLPIEETTEEKTMEELIELLKLKAGATRDEIIASVQALKTTAATEVIACKEVVDALGLTDQTGKSELVAAIHVLKAQGSGVSQADFLVLKNKLAVRDRDDLVTMALAAGKVTPAQKDWAENYALKDPDGFKIFIAKAPVVVPSGEQAGGSGTKKEGEIDETQMMINKHMGIDNETFKKHQTV